MLKLPRRSKEKCRVQSVKSQPVGVDVFEEYVEALKNIYIKITICLKF